MGAESISVVADAGPLIHLAEIDCLSLLEVFAILHLPDAVFQEIRHYEQSFSADIIGLPNVQRHVVGPAEVTRFIQANHLEDLHFGERECLSGLTMLVGLCFLKRSSICMRFMMSAVSLSHLQSSSWQLHNFIPDERLSQNY